MEPINSKFIINADDFGYNSNRNAAILYCLKKNLINSTTIMVNTEGFEEAVDLAHTHNLKKHIGIHLNLTQGKPLTDLSDTGLLNEDGTFKQRSDLKPVMLFSSAIRNKIMNELRQQYDKLLKAKIVPTHIDSHHSVHITPWVANVFFDFARNKKQKIRIADDRFRKNLAMFVHYKLLNIRYKKNKLNFSDRFETVNSFIKNYNKPEHRDLTYEIMVHPAFKDNIIIDTVENVNLEESIIHLRKHF